MILSLTISGHHRYLRYINGLPYIRLFLLFVIYIALYSQLLIMIQNLNFDHSFNHDIEKDLGIRIAGL